MMYIAVACLGYALLLSLGYFSEKKKYNNGINPKSGLPWEYFDTDSQGGRGYMDSEGNTCWISYPFID